MCVAEPDDVGLIVLAFRRTHDVGRAGMAAVADIVRASRGQLHRAAATLVAHGLPLRFLFDIHRNLAPAASRLTHHARPNGLSLLTPIWPRTPLHARREARSTSS